MLKNIALSITIAVGLLSLAGCPSDDSDPTTSCVQQAETACDGADSECKQAIMDDCTPPPPCTAPTGQHC